MSVIAKFTSIDEKLKDALPAHSLSPRKEHLAPFCYHFGGRPTQEGEWEESEREVDCAVCLSVESVPDLWPTEDS